jgi:hypothetical protein
MERAKDILEKRYANPDWHLVVHEGQKSLKVYGELSNDMFDALKHEIWTYFPQFKDWMLLWLRKEERGSWNVERCTTLVPDYLKYAHLFH